MADKMWDILNFLKNPSGDDSNDKDVRNVEAKIKEINAQIEDAIEHPERELKPQSRGDESAAAPPDSDGRPVRADGGGGSAQQKSVNPEPEKAKRKSQDDGKPSLTEPEAAEKPEADESLPEGRLVDALVSSIRPNPFQPRKELGEQEIIELSESIKELGLLQPILVKRVDDGYELIAGERRLRAATRAGLDRIPALVVETEPLNQQIIALVENIQRKNLSSIEEALSLQDIISKTGWSQSELSRRLGRSQASIANKLRLLRLDSEVRDLVLSGRLGERQARALLALSPENQKALAQKAVDEDLSARAVETLAENWGEKPARTKQRPSRGTGAAPGGELLGDVAALVNRHKSRGLTAQWKVKQMNQSSLVVEITVDLMKTASDGEAAEQQ